MRSAVAGKRTPLVPSLRFAAGWHYGRLKLGPLLPACRHRPAQPALQLPGAGTPRLARAGTGLVAGWLVACAWHATRLQRVRQDLELPFRWCARIGIAEARCSGSVQGDEDGKWSFADPGQR